MEPLKMLIVLDTQTKQQAMRTWLLSPFKI
jgi:hypothetical protein